MARYRDNLLLLTDSYKVTHWALYPPGTQRVYSYFESRGGRFPETVAFGLQVLLAEVLEGAVVTHARIDHARDRLARHFGRPLLHEAGWRRVVDECGGRLPVSIRAVPEGAVVPVRNVLLTIENTRDFAFWLPSYLETLLVQQWYPMTVTTLSREVKKLIAAFLDETGDLAELPFKLHDFGFRGASSIESAALGGAAHLVNFEGSDTLAAVELVAEHYDCEMAGFSVPATEHSVMSMWTEAGERDAFARALAVHPEGVLSVVSDTWDVFRVCEAIVGADPLRSRVLRRSGPLVIRPDSGDPVAVILRCLELLAKAFGTVTNAKGFRELPPQLRLLWGDAVELESLREILAALRDAGWSTGLLVFGMGGGLLQKVDRDTQQFAFKAAWGLVAGDPPEGRAVYKEPATGPDKVSKRGRMKLAWREGPAGPRLATVPESSPEPDQLVEVFRDGRILRRWRFAEVRERARLLHGS